MEERKTQIARYSSGKPVVVSDLASFQIGKQIGEGGTSLVYETTIVGSPHKYAMKIFADDTNNGTSSGYKRFLQAYTNLLSFQHLGFLLPQIYWGFLEIPESGRFPYSVMLRADGTLQSEYKKADLSFQDFVKLFDTIADKIEELHRCDIIHRDLKPQNLFLLKGRLLIGDCDIASFDDERHLKLVPTQTGDRLANYSFSAPEQSEPVIGELSASADWYAFGQIMHWLATKTTYRGTGSVSLGFNEKRTGLYNQIVTRLLSKDPERRFQSLREIRAHIQAQDESTAEELRISKIHRGLSKFDEIIYKYTSDHGMSRTCASDVVAQDEIRDICNFLSANVGLLDLWMCHGSSDFKVEKVIDKGGQRFLFDYLEMEIDKISVFRLARDLGGSLLVLHANAIPPIGKVYPDQDEEEVCLFDDIPIKRSEYDTGWARIDGKLIETFGRTSLVVRTISKTFYFLSPHFGPPMSNFDLLCSTFYKYQKRGITCENLIEELKGMRRCREASMYD